MRSAIGLAIRSVAFLLLPVILPSPFHQSGCCCPSPLNISFIALTSPTPQAFLRNGDELVSAHAQLNFRATGDVLGERIFADSGDLGCITRVETRDHFRRNRTLQPTLDLKAASAVRMRA